MIKLKFIEIRVISVGRIWSDRRMSEIEITASFKCKSDPGLCSLDKRFRKHSKSKNKNIDIFIFTIL